METIKDQLIELVYLGEEDTLLRIDGEKVKVKNDDSVKVSYAQAEDLTLRYSKKWILKSNVKAFKEAKEEEQKRFKKYETVPVEVKKKVKKDPLEQKKKKREERKKAKEEEKT